MKIYVSMWFNIGRVSDVAYVTGCSIKNKGCYTTPKSLGKYLAVGKGEKTPILPSLLRTKEGHVG